MTLFIILSMFIILEKTVFKLNSYHQYQPFLKSVQDNNFNNNHSVDSHAEKHAFQSVILVKLNG